MIIDTLYKFEAAKNALIKENGDVNAAAVILKNSGSSIFEYVSSEELSKELILINEGLKDSILNFISQKIGGDIKKLKTALSQMKEQELKFNREEFEIYKEFYSLLKKQRALEKDKTNPNYSDMMRTIMDSRKALNNRMRELTKTHNDIFSALEEKIKSLTKDNDRKKSYFNAQRASDVLVTKTDRYSKFKEISKMSKDDVDQLEKFFGVDKDDMVSDIDKSREAAKKAETNLKSYEGEIQGDADFIMGFINRFNKIKSSKINIEDAVKKLDSLSTQVIEEMSNGEHSPDDIKKLQDLDEDIRKTVTFLLKAKDAGKIKMTEVKA